MEKVIFEILINKNNVDAERKIMWTHMQLDEFVEETYLAEKYNIPINMIEALMSKKSRPRFIQEKNKLFLSVRAINYNKGEEKDDMVFLHIYIEKNKIITIRHRKVFAIDNIRETILNGKIYNKESEFLLELLSKITKNISQVIEHIDDKVDLIEDKIIEKSDLTLRSSLSMLRRESINLKRFISPQREVFGYLIFIKLDWLDSSELYKLRELNEKYIRYLEEINNIRDRALIIHEEINSIYSEKLNNTMYTLSVVSAIFLPLGFFTGLLGINVGGIPGVENKSAFLLVTLLLVVVVVVELVILKIKKWI